jgi:hypothetical protein
METTLTHRIPLTDVRFVKELYPRLKPLDDVIERYRDALDNLPPITVAKGGVLVDGYHRWQAHVREGAETIEAEDLGDLTDAEIIRESIQRNASHGQQLSRADKKRLAGQLWGNFAEMKPAERVTEIATLLAVSERSVQEWTKDSRKAEKEAQQAKAWGLHLDCLSFRDIAEAVGADHTVVRDWVLEKRESAEFQQPPDSRQHFDVWQFQQEHEKNVQAWLESYGFTVGRFDDMSPELHRALPLHHPLRHRPDFVAVKDGRVILADAKDRDINNRTGNYSVEVAAVNTANWLEEAYDCEVYFVFPGRCIATPWHIVEYGTYRKGEPGRTDYYVFPAHGCADLASLN